MRPATRDQARQNGCGGASSRGIRAPFQAQGAPREPGPVLRGFTAGWFGYSTGSTARFRKRHRAVSGFLLDTNVVSELVRPKPDDKVLRWVEETDESILFLSVLTLGEIRNGVQRLRSGRRRGRLESWLQVDLRFRFQDRVLPIDAAIADRWGTVSALAAAKGKPVPVIDGLLAATALHHDLTLVTRNSKDVSATGVPTLNPWL